ncbi:hypothetical protein ACFL6D_04180, partial [Spirochaetota bacterium]
SINSGNWGRVETNADTFSTNVDISWLTDGDTIFSFILVSTNSTTNKDSVTIEVDNTGPSVSIVETNRHFYFDLTVHLTADDPNGVSGIYFTKDGMLPTLSSDMIPVGGSVFINQELDLQYMAVDSLGNKSTNHITEFMRLANEPYPQWEISNIYPIPFCSGQEELTIELHKKDRNTDIRIFVIDMHGNMQAVINDPNKEFYRSIFSFDGINIRQKKLGRGLYYLMIELNGKLNRKVMRKIYIDCR